MRQKWLIKEQASCPAAGGVRCFFGVLAVALTVLTPWGCQKEDQIDRNYQGQITLRNGSTSSDDSATAENSSDSRQSDVPLFWTGSGDPEKVYRVDIKIFNTLAKESLLHKKRTEWFKPGRSQIDYRKTAKRKGELPQKKRIQEMIPTRYRVEEFVSDKLIATYLNDAEDNKWKLYYEDGKLMAHARGAASASIYEDFLQTLSLLSKMPDTLKGETRDGKSILKYVSRKFGSCPILTFEVLTEEDALTKIEEAKVSVVHDSEELYSMSLKVDRDPGEMEDSLFELPDSAIIDEDQIYLNEIEKKATRMYVENDTEGLAAIVGELESNSERFEDDVRYYTMLWQYSLGSKQFDKAFKYLDKMNKIKPDEALYNKITTLMMCNPEQARNDDELIGELRERCARVDKHDMSGLLGCAGMLKLVGLDDEAGEFYKAAAHAKPYDFILLRDSYQYHQGSTQQILNEFRQTEKQAKPMKTGLVNPLSDE